MKKKTTVKKKTAAKRDTVASLRAQLSRVIASHDKWRDEAARFDRLRVEGIERHIAEQNRAKAHIDSLRQDLEKQTNTALKLNQENAQLQKLLANKNEVINRHMLAMETIANVIDMFEQMEGD